MKKKPGLDKGNSYEDKRRSKVAVTPTRRGVIQAAAAAGMIGSVPAAARKSFAASSNKKPNILLVFPDQHRHDAIAAAGDPAIKTPTMDRLIEEGTLFRKMWCQSPVCRPARASLLTTRYPHQHGITGGGAPAYDPKWPTFLKNLQAAGYTTGSFGKTHYSNFFEAEQMEDPTGTLNFDVRSSYGYIASFGLDKIVDEGGQWFPAMNGFGSSYTDFLRANGVLETYRKQIREHWREGDDHFVGFINDFAQEYDVTSFLAKEVIDWLDKRDQSKPFYLAYAPVKPHPPYSADSTWAAYYKDKPMPQGPREHVVSNIPVWDAYLGKKYGAGGADIDRAQVDESKRMYYAMISLVDQKLGEIMAALEKRGELDNTWIIWSSDHGEMMGDHGLVGKSVFYHAAVGVPGIIRPAKGAPVEKFSSMPAEVIDITATMLEIAGAKPLDGSGRSLVPAMHGKETQRYAFSEIKGQKDTLFVAVSDGRYRYTVEQMSKTPCELFDLQEDPDEVTNLVNDPAGKKQAAQMQADLIEPHMADKVL